MKTAALAALLAALSFAAAHASAATITFDFENGNDNGFGLKFSNDASANFPIVSIGGSKRMEIARTGAFQEADRISTSTSDPFYLALNAALHDPSNYTISYDYYIDTSLSPGNYGNFLQLGTYLNAGTGAYAQDFPGSNKDFELSPTQLASGQVFSGTITETLATKYGGSVSNLADTDSIRFGFILNGDGSQPKVYYDNITITPLAATPEPASLSLAALGAATLLLRRRRNA
jgi:hypothetical protein